MLKCLSVPVLESINKIYNILFLVQWLKFPEVALDNKDLKNLILIYADQNCDLVYQDFKIIYIHFVKASTKADRERS